MPLTAVDALMEGWVPMQGFICLKGLGMPFVQPGSENATKTNKPIILYYTPGGQIAGMGVFVLGNSKPNLVGFFFLDAGKSGDKKRKFISVTFRSEDAVCSSAKSKYPLGDRLVINAGAGGIKMELPLTTKEAMNTGWIRGSCFATMGAHWFRDLTGTDLTWEANNLLPIVLMYDEESTGADNLINAFFFAAADQQQTVRAYKRLGVLILAPPVDLLFTLQLLHSLPRRKIQTNGSRFPCPPL